MSQKNESFILRAHKDQSGQILPLMALMMVALLAMTGLVIDFARLFVSYRLLQTSTDAAALAGGSALPFVTATDVATKYSGVSGNKNAYSNLPPVTMATGYPKLLCLQTLKNQGIPCEAPAVANAIQVKQIVTVPMTFAAIVGAKSLTLAAIATAARTGSAPSPTNVVVVLDTTASMNGTDGGSNCSGSRLDCSLQGLQTLLSTLSPCSSSLASCGTATNGNVPNPIDTVSLLTFPAVTEASVPNAYDCSGNNPTVQPYPLPLGPSYTPPVSPTYQIVNFSSDYRKSANNSSLNTNSNLTLAAGGKQGCGLQAPGGQNTYYAAVIYAAENLLLAQQAANPQTQNAMIILSDGDAEAGQANMAPGANNLGIYPSYRQECHQAITAAQWAAAQGVGGTKVYSISYGSASSGCATDSSPSITPCQTMEQMASSPGNFYSDYGSSTNGCVSASQPTSNLNQIFSAIGGGLSGARLIPEGLP